MNTQNLTAAASLEVGIIGIGNGGSQSGVALAKEGFPVILLNTSSRDLDSQVIPDTIPSYIIQDGHDIGRGAGRNRETSKLLFGQFLQDEKLLQDAKFKVFTQSKDVILILASTAGGTGSGIAPTLAFQLRNKYPNKVIIICGILPRLSESINSQQNSIQFINELEQLAKMGSEFPYALFDLNKYEGMPAEMAYTRVANDITELAKIIRGDYAMITKYDSIDERDMLTTISKPGMITSISASAKQTEIQSEGIQALMLKQMRAASSVSSQDKIASYLAIFISVDDSIDDDIKKANYQTLFDTIGEPFEVFINYGLTDRPNGHFAALITGQPLPYDRLSRSIDRVEEHQKDRKQKDYSVVEASAGFQNYAKNPEIGKILGSSDTEANNAPVVLPDFLKPSI